MTRILSMAATGAILALGALSVSAATAPPQSDAPQLDMETQQCASRADMVQALGETFQESQTAQGVINPDVVMEVFVSEQGTWTILATGTDGNSCVISAGEGWDADMLAALPGA